MDETKTPSEQPRQLIQLDQPAPTTLSPELDAWLRLSEEEQRNTLHNQVFHGLDHTPTKCERDHTPDFGPGMTGELGGQVPVQGEGLLDGRPWYFRARYNSWSFDWSDAADVDPVEVSLGYAPGLHYEELYKVEDPYAAGYMSLDEAFVFVCQARDIVRHPHVWSSATEKNDDGAKGHLRCSCGTVRLSVAAVAANLAEHEARMAENEVRMVENAARPLAIEEEILERTRKRRPTTSTKEQKRG